MQRHARSECDEQPKAMAEAVSSSAAHPAYITQSKDGPEGEDFVLLHFAPQQRIEAWDGTAASLLIGSP
ncbi:MAG TPA: hypothetical protein VMK12_13490 [Anaeromyxobacteraceae bacterium]|nr:hypothetical protein [Anaeromyxobacteraceae bacterium]